MNNLAIGEGNARFLCHLRTLPVAGKIGGLAFSPDGATRAAASDDGALHLWRCGDWIDAGTELSLWCTSDSALLRTFAPATGIWLYGVAIEPHSRFIACGADGAVLLIAVPKV